MKLKNAPVDQADMGDVSQVKAFAIKSTAHSFRILSSGLYANKIRAIIRELSCNAYDSHVAAGREHEPFEVHLPSTLEPWFSIRDRGIGLDHEQVINLYTTYFESTKTDSNLFIGALGLGSKSPFSYTDNFTVTAVKNGVKGIYSAFINDQGVPSVALMSQTPSNEDTGVEVRMAVGSEEDFYKFREEARVVLQWFKTLPTVTGEWNFQITPREYQTQDIVPGVHLVRRGWGRNSVAVMGNIAYPIDVPNKKENLGTLSRLLDCGLELHFDIGQLDFQASREGLSYIPSTIDAIRDKLQQLKDHLIVQLDQEAKAITNQWELAYYLMKQSRSELWEPVAIDWLAANPVATLRVDSYNRYVRAVEQRLTEPELREKYNIRITQLTNLGSGYRARSPSKAYVNGKHIAVFEIGANSEYAFVINDIKTGGIRRACDYFGEQQGRKYVYVLTPADATAPMDTAAFFAQLHGPPDSQIFAASAFAAPEPVKTERSVTVLARTKHSDHWSAVDWSRFDDTTTYYYVPLKGYQLTSQYGLTDVKDLVTAVDALGVKLHNNYIYGVRKVDLPVIEQRSNWVNLETHVHSLLTSMTESQLSQLVPHRKLMSYAATYIQEKIFKEIDLQGAYGQFVSRYGKNGVYHDRSLSELQQVIEQMLGPDSCYSQMVKEHDQLRQQVIDRYPLITALDTYSVDTAHVVHYINIIDQSQQQEKN